MEMVLVLIGVIVVHALCAKLGRRVAGRRSDKPTAALEPAASLPPPTPTSLAAVDATEPYPASTTIKVLPQGIIYGYPDGRFRVVVTVAKDQALPAGKHLRVCQDGARRIDLGMFNTWSEAVRAYEQKQLSSNLPPTKPDAKDSDSLQPAQTVPKPQRFSVQGIYQASGVSPRTLNGRAFVQSYLDVALASGSVKRIWGEDLPRALEASHAEPGERIGVIFQGLRDVAVEEDGKIQIKQKRMFEVQRLA